MLDCPKDLKLVQPCLVMIWLNDMLGQHSKPAALPRWHVGIKLAAGFDMTAVVRCDTGWRVTLGFVTHWPLLHLTTAVMSQKP